MIDLTNNIALITGAAKRLGRATALALADAGVSVIVHYRDSETEAVDLANAIESSGVKAWTLRADLSEPAQSESLYGRAVELAGRVDYVINNASFFHEDTVLDFDLSELMSNINVHAAAPLLIARAHAKAEHPGAIVNFLDARMVDYDRNHAAYHLSKRMLFTLTRMLAVELAPAIRVNGIAPGLILPPEGKDEAYLESLAHTNPLNRYGAQEDVAEAVLFLLKSNFVTGQVLFVDGGRHMAGTMYG